MQSAFGPKDHGTTAISRSTYLLKNKAYEMLTSYASISDSSDSDYDISNSFFWTVLH